MGVHFGEIRDHLGGRGGVHGTDSRLRARECGEGAWPGPVQEDGGSLQQVLGDGEQRCAVHRRLSSSQKAPQERRFMAQAEGCFLLSPCCYGFLRSSCKKMFLPEVCVP